MSRAQQSQCAALTRSKTQCKRMATVGSKFCAQHGKFRLHWKLDGGSISDMVIPEPVSPTWPSWLLGRKQPPRVVAQPRMMRPNELIPLTLFASSREAERAVDTLVGAVGRIQTALDGKWDTLKGWHTDERIARFVQLVKIVANGDDGVVAAAKLHYSPNNINEDVVVKTAPQGTEWNPQDRLDYEFFIGRKLNSLRELVPHFSLMIMRYHCRTNGITPDDLRTCVDNGSRMRDFLVMQQVKPGWQWRRMIETMRTDQGLSLSHELSFFVMIGLALQVAQDRLEFNHNNLNPYNVLVESLPSQDRHGVFAYEYDGRKYYVPLPSNRFPVMIDFGRSHVHRDSQSLKAWGLSPSLQTDGEKQHDIGKIDRKHPVRMTQFYPWIDMMELWCRWEKTQSRPFPPDVARVEQEIENSVEWSVWHPDPVAEPNWFYRTPLRLRPNAPYVRPIDLVNALMRCEVMRDVQLQTLEKGNIEMYMWNSERDRGLLDEARTQEEVQAWKSTMVGR